MSNIFIKPQMEEIIRNLICMENEILKEADEDIDLNVEDNITILTLLIQKNINNCLSFAKDYYNDENFKEMKASLMNSIEKQIEEFN